MWCWDLSQIQIVFLVHIIFSNSLAVTKARLCASSYPTNGIEILFIHHSQSYLNKVVSFYFLNNAVVYWTVFTLRSLRRLHFWIGFYYQIQFMSASNGIVLHLMSYWNRVFMKCIQRVMFVIQYTCSHIHNLYQWSQCVCEYAFHNRPRCLFLLKKWQQKVKYISVAIIFFWHCIRHSVNNSVFCVSNGNPMNTANPNEMRE